MVFPVLVLALRTAIGCHVPQIHAASARQEFARCDLEVGAPGQGTFTHDGVGIDGLGLLRVLQQLVFHVVVPCKLVREVPKRLPRACRDKGSAHRFVRVSGWDLKIKGLGKRKQQAAGDGPGLCWLGSLLRFSRHPAQATPPRMRRRANAAMWAGTRPSRTVTKPGITRC